MGKLLTFLLDCSEQFAYHAFMDLKTYLDIEKRNKGTTRKQFAGRIPISKTYLQEIIAGKKLPRPKIGRAIECCSGGEVKYIDIIHRYELKNNEAAQ